MKNILYQLEEKLGKGRILVNESLFKHTTFQIGGSADFYFEAGTVEELVKAVEAAKKLAIPFFILGGGSNILCGDKGFKGLVIKNKTKKIKIMSYSGQVKSSAFAKASADKQNLQVKSVLIEAESGVLMNQLVRYTLDEGLEGLEGFLGLPGTVGGAVIGNAHWQEKTVKDSVVSTRCLPATPSGCEIILSAVFQLRKGEKNDLWEKAKEAVEHRQQTQPLNFPSAGCIFKNLKKSEAIRLGLPNLTTSTGFLIEACGLVGLQAGNAQISTKHANFIVNLGGAKAADMIELIEKIKEKVKEKFGVELKEEIIKVGNF